MNIAPISISLPVQHIAMSMAFYETLGFGVVEGGHVKDYAVLYDDDWPVSRD
jgi:predicted lactoylglutathione lyase